MVAPLSSIAGAENSGLCNPTFRRHVFRLPEHLDAQAKMAPSLRDAIRGVLQDKQIPPEAINIYLTKNASITRYDSAFKILWALCRDKGFDLKTASWHQIAAEIIYLNSLSPAQARNAYSALLLIPGFDQIRFPPCLIRAKARGIKARRATPPFGTPESS